MFCRNQKVYFNRDALPDFNQSLLSICNESKLILNDYHNFIINGESYQPPVGVNLVFHYRNRLRRGCSQACFLTISNFSMDAVHDERISRKFCSIRQRSHRSHHRLAFREHSAICYGLHSHIQGTAAWRILTTAQTLGIIIGNSRQRPDPISQFPVRPIHV